MKWYTEKKESRMYASIFSSELEFISSLAAEWGSTETGGELYGLWTHAGRPMIMQATPPGPNATHQTAHFRQDIDYFMKMTEVIYKRFGLQFIGDYHSHHYLGLDHPSSGDARHIRSIATKNNLTRMVQFIICLKGDAPQNFRLTDEKLAFVGSLGGEIEFQEGKRRCHYLKDWRKRWWSFPGQAGYERVEIHSFFYQNAESGEWVECPIKVTPGMSPIREFLFRNGFGLRSHSYFFYPFDRIVYNLSDRQPASNNRRFPYKLKRQCLELSKRISKKITINDDHVNYSILFPLPNKWNATVVYSGRWPYPVETVFINNIRSESIEVTRNALLNGQDTKLTDIYDGLISLCKPERKVQANIESAGQDIEGKV